MAHAVVCHVLKCLQIIKLLRLNNAEATFVTLTKYVVVGVGSNLAVFEYYKFTQVFYTRAHTIIYDLNLHKISGTQLQYNSTEL